MDEKGVEMKDKKYIGYGEPVNLKPLFHVLKNATPLSFELQGSKLPQLRVNDSECSYES